MPGEWIRIGEVTAPHGINGEVRVVSLSDSPGRFASLRQCHIEKADGSRINCRLHSARPHKGMFVVKIEGVESRDEAEGLRRAFLVVPKEAVGPLPEGHYYVFQLVGLKVQTVQGEFVGSVKDVLTAPGNDVYVIARSGEKDAYIPAVKQVVKEIDVLGGRMVIDPIPGLLDEGGS